MRHRRKKKERRQHFADHTDHLNAHEDHAKWLKDLGRWRFEYEEAVRDFARHMLPELEIDGFEDALDRHEAAIQAHEELVDRHERMIQLEMAGAEGASEEFEPVHGQMDARHELSRREHERLERRHRAILRAMATARTRR